MNPAAFLMMPGGWSGTTCPGAAPVQSCASQPLHVHAASSAFSWVNLLKIFAVCNAHLWNLPYYPTAEKALF